MLIEGHYICSGSCFSCLPFGHRHSLSCLLQIAGGLHTLFLMRNRVSKVWLHLQQSGKVNKPLLLFTAIHTQGSTDIINLISSKLPSPASSVQQPNPLGLCFFPIVFTLLIGQIKLDRSELFTPGIYVSVASQDKLR